MKRVFVVIVVVLMLAGYIVGVASGDGVSFNDTVVENTNKMLSVIKGIYDSNREAFDADYLYLAYLYYKLKNSAQDCADWERMWTDDIKTNEIAMAAHQVFFTDQVKTMKKTNAQLQALIDEQYMKWLDGEIDDDKFAKILFIGIE